MKQFIFLFSFLLLGSTTLLSQDNQVLAQSAYGKAEAAFGNGNHQEAEKQLKQAVSYLNGQTNPQLQYLFTKIYFDRKDWLLANNAMESYFELSSEEHQYYISMVDMATTIKEKANPIIEAKKLEQEQIRLVAKEVEFFNEQARKGKEGLEYYFENGNFKFWQNSSKNNPLPIAIKRARKALKLYEAEVDAHSLNENNACSFVEKYDNRNDPIPLFEIKTDRNGELYWRVPDQREKDFNIDTPDISQHYINAKSLCRNDKLNKLHLKDGYLIDPRDKEKYKVRVLSDGKYWMMENLRFKMPGRSFLFDDKEKYYEYGIIYKSSDSPCPSGWRLPSIEDVIKTMPSNKILNNLLSEKTDKLEDSRTFYWDINKDFKRIELFCAKWELKPYIIAGIQTLNIIHNEEIHKKPKKKLIDMNDYSSLHLLGGNTLELYALHIDLKNKVNENTLSPCRCVQE